MTGYTTLLEEALESWTGVRGGVLDELRNIPEKDFGFRPRPESRTVAELARHILESGHLAAGELTKPDGDFRRKSYAALLAEHGRGVARLRTRKALLAGLARGHRAGEKRLRRAGELAMLQRIRRFDGLLGTRLAWLHHAIAHEEYHRGQLALYARLLGRVPALTQRIYG